MFAIDTEITVATDGAVLAFFDTDIVKQTGLKTTAKLPADVENIESVQAGKIALVGLESDRIYPLRITTSELTQDERDYAVCKVGPLGFVVRSGMLSISGYWNAPLAASSLAGELEPVVEFPVGEYCVDFYQTVWWYSPRWWSRKRQSTPIVGAPACLIARVTPRTESFSAPENWRLSYERNNDQLPAKYLFDSTTRIVGTQIGMELTAEVTGFGDARRLIAHTTIEGSRWVELDSKIELKRTDRIRFRVTDIDHENRVLRGAFLSKY